MLLVNLYGVPSAGKSSGAAYIFSQFKMKGVNAELVTEFAKDKVWEESKEVFNNQAYIFGKQYFRITRVDNKVDVVVTDSPLLLSVFYNKSEVLGEQFNSLVANVSKSYNSLDILLLRDKPYNPTGRFQTEEESDALLEPMKELLDKYKIKYQVFKGNESDYNKIVELILDKINWESGEQARDNYRYFKKNFEEFMYEYPGKILLLKDCSVLKVFDTYKSAIDYAINFLKLKYGEFSVQEVTKELITIY